jgi:hypothetical protein
MNHRQMGQSPDQRWIGPFYFFTGRGFTRGAQRDHHIIVFQQLIEFSRNPDLFIEGLVILPR